MDESDVQRVKVCFVVLTLDGMGGSEKVVFDVASGLDRTVFEPLVVSPVGGHIADLYRAEGIRTFVFPRRTRFDPRFHVGLRSLLRREKVDVINPHHLSMLSITSGPASATNTPIAFSEHSRWEMEQLSDRDVRHLRSLSNRCGAVVSVSRALNEYFVDEIDVHPSRAHWIPNGVDVTHFDDAEPLDLRVELGLPGNASIIGIIAHMRPEKNYPVLLAAFEQAAAARPDAHLVVAGNDLMDGQILRLVESSPARSRVHLLGARADVPSLLRELDVFCLPSKYEGMPMTILEAMAAGVPVVGSDVLGIQELIVPDRTGFLCPEGDPTALARALLRALDDQSLRDEVVSNARAEVYSRYRLTSTVEAYANVFSQLAGR